MSISHRGVNTVSISHRGVNTVSISHRGVNTVSISHRGVSTVCISNRGVSTVSISHRGVSTVCIFNRGVSTVCIIFHRALFDGQRKKLDQTFKPRRQSFVMCGFCSKSIASDSLRHGGCGLVGVIIM